MATPNTPHKPDDNELPKNIPVIEKKDGPSGSVRLNPEDFDDGVYVSKSMYAGEEFALGIAPDDRLGRTHKAMNNTHYWEGTESEFRNSFTEKDGKPIAEAKPATTRKRK